MLTTAQNTSLAVARAAVANANTPRDKIRTANEFRAIVAIIADEIGCDECVVVLAGGDLTELNCDDCDRLIDLLEDNARDLNI